MQPATPITRSPDRNQLSSYDESTDFGEGARGETSMEGWGGGLRFGWLVGSFVLLVPLFVSLTPPFWLCVR